mmetsp:Transcript_8991/g.12401  ORF Transcript_8991/g.12401 Transcript_8991/m.12401 type:complete len:262 (+) Transcript_8991:52-837(+)
MEGKRVERRPSKASTASGNSSDGSSGADSHGLHSLASNEDADALRSESTMMQWTVQLSHRKKGRVGMQVVETMRSSKAVIMAVHAGGQIAAWNSRHPNEQVRAGDVILQVNDVTCGAREIMEEIVRPREKLILRLGRYVTFPVRMQSQYPGGLGLVEDHLRIVRVEPESSASHYCNKAVTPPEFWLWPGDRIVACNGYESEQEIRANLRQADRVNMLVQRHIPGAKVDTKELTFTSMADGAWSLMESVGLTDSFGIKQGSL